MKCLYLSVAVGVLALAFAPQTVAGPLPTCTNDSISLTSISKSADGSAQNLLVAGPYTASDCAGIYGDPNNVGNLHDANPNIGTYGDGLLNGEGGWLSPTRFISESQLMDLGPNVGYPDANPSIADDPGWISLAKFDLNDDNSWTEQYQAINWLQYLDLDEVLDISFTCTSASGCSSGSWSLATSLDVIEKVQGALGNRSTFDHLAFVFKSGNKNSNGGWSVYDFNFTDIFANELSAQADDRFGDPFGTPFTFGGLFNTGDFDKDISHFAIWARDPLSISQQVPAPGSILLLGLGLLALRLYKKH